MRMQVASLAGWVFGCLSLGWALAGETPVARERVQFEFVRAISFKDGNCLIVKRGVGTTNAAGELFTEEVPDSAILGSFWAAPKDGRLICMTAGYEKVKESVTERVACGSQFDILRSNKGKVCTVTMADKTEYHGTLREVLSTPVQTDDAAATAAALPVGYWPGARNYGHAGYYNADPSTASWGAVSGAMPPKVSVTVSQGQLFVLKTAAGDVVLPVGDVKSVLLADAAIETEKVTTTERSVKRLTLKFADAGKLQEFELMYFTPGLRWVPTYRMELPAAGAPKLEARIALQAELLNEVEDLIDVPIDLVVGVPNFRFKDTISPLSLETVLRTVLSHTLDTNFALNSQVSNAYFSNRGDAGRHVAGGEAAPDALATLQNDITGSGSQDLFVYSLPKMTLKKGHRAAVPVFEVTAPYSDIYLWKIQAQNDGSNPNQGRNHSPLTVATNSVWHAIELTNPSQLPWTTGPVMILQGRQPIAQELLTYTAMKGTTQVPLTVAVDIQSGYTEEEIGRQTDFVRWLGYAYYRLDRKGTATITNRKPQPVPVRITREVLGKAVKASDGGVITLGTEMNQAGHEINPQSRIEWNVELQPGATLTRTLEYQLLVRQ